MPTITDVANACGLSTATVSYVINNHTLKVSPKTRERVLKVVQEMNFQPSALARGLSNQRANMIGVVVQAMPHLLTNSFYGALIDGVAERAGAMDQMVGIYNGRFWRNEQKTQSVFADGRCDGVLLITADPEPELLRELQKIRLPFVTVNPGVLQEGVNSVDIDNVEAGYRMTRYLLDQGHRKIACLKHRDCEFNEGRLQGYRRALDEYGVAFDDRRIRIIPLLDGDEDTSVRVKQIVGDRSLGITAIFAASDEVARHAITAIHELGLRVPADISIVGINDTVDAVRERPQLTTLRQSPENIAASAVSLLLDAINNPTLEPLHIIAPTELIVRESVSPPRDRTQPNDWRSWFHTHGLSRR